MNFSKIFRGKKRRSKSGSEIISELSGSKLIDIYITTYQRADLLEQCLLAVSRAVKKSPYKHRVIVLSDSTNNQTIEVVKPYLGEMHFVSTSEQLGLPFSFNLMHDYSHNLISRTEKKPELICYLQDDALIQYPDHYFKVVGKMKDHLSYDEQGFLSGFYTPIHPGFEKETVDGITVVKSDSIDGKNIIGTPELFDSIGPISWRYMGLRRGNPNPLRGSGFDLWQWRDSPNSIQKQKRVNLIIPGLVTHIGDDQSTWGNKSDTEEKIQERVQKGNVYNTRNQYPSLSIEEHFSPS